MSKKSKTKKGQVEIRCGVGIITLATGEFLFFLELHIEEHVFHFESLTAYKDESHADESLMRCMEALPNCVAEAAKKSDFKMVEDFCKEWKIHKVDDPGVEINRDDEPEGDLH